MSGGKSLELVTVFASGDAARVTVAKLMLETEGIPFVSKGEGVQDLLGWGRLFSGLNLATGPVQIQVRPQDVERARESLRELT